MPKVSTAPLKKFKNLTQINDGFRLPDQAYVLGKDFECFEKLGGSLYFSNYWYGDEQDVKTFAQSLIDHLHPLYKNHQFEDGDYDFFGMVVVWNMGEKAIVGSIVLDDEYVFGDDIPEELQATASPLRQLLNDLNDNSLSNLYFELQHQDMPKEEQIHILEAIGEPTALVYVREMIAENQ